MKSVKGLCFGAGLAMLAVFGSGCASGYVNNFGFGSTMPATLYSETTRGGFMLPKTENLEYIQILGDVKGESSMINVLFLVSTGDAGIEAAKKNALIKYPNADDIINVEVDTEHSTILSVYNRSKTVLRGKAIKYIKK